MSPDLALPNSPSRLASIAALVVLVLGAVGTGVSWSRCALGHWHGHIHGAELMCLIAGLGAFAAAIAFTVGGTRSVRRGASARELWTMDAALLALGFAGGSLQLQLLDDLGLGFGTRGGSPLDVGLAPSTLHGIGAVAATAVMFELLRMAGPLGRGERAGRRGIACIAGMAAVVLGWCVATGLAHGAIGATTLAWIIDPTPTLACFGAGAIASGAVRMLRIGALARPIDARRLATGLR